MFNNGYEYMKQLTGLFLGAGASYEAGLPLVWELTDELKKWLTPAKLREFNQGWRLQGGRPRSAEIIGRNFVSSLSTNLKGGDQSLSSQPNRGRPQKRNGNRIALRRAQRRQMAPRT
jgi:hypothetical protein